MNETEQGAPINDSPQPTTSKKTNWLLPLGLLVVLVVIIIIAFFGKDFFTNNAVATVNGETITRKEFDTRLEQAKDVYAGQGVDISNEETLKELEELVLEEMINQTLLYNKAREAGVSASDEEVEEDFQNIANQLGGEEALREELEKENITEAELRKNIEEGIVIRKFIEQEMGAAAQNVTEDELNDLYEQYVAFQEQSQQEAAPIEDVREDLEENIKQQKMQEFVTDFIAQLREESDIEIKL